MTTAKGGKRLKLAQAPGCALGQFCVRGGFIRPGEQVIPMFGPHGEPVHLLCWEGTKSHLAQMVRQLAPVLAVMSRVVVLFGPKAREACQATAELRIALRLADAGHDPEPDPDGDGGANARRPEPAAEPGPEPAADLPDRS